MFSKQVKKAPEADFLYQFRNSEPLAHVKAESILALKTYPVGLLSESELEDDQRLMSVFVPGASEFGLWFNGAASTVSWGLVYRKPAGVVLQSVAQRRGLVDGVTWAPGTRDQALELYEKLANELRQSYSGQKPAAKPVKTRLRSALEITLCVIAAFLVFSMLFTVLDPDKKVTAVPAPVAQVPAYTPMDAGIPDDARASAAEIEQIKALKGKVAMRESGIAFYVFTDPNCQFCLELEKNLAKLDPKYNPVMIPLGFKDGSMSKSSSVLCLAEGQRAKAWSEMMAGSQQEAKACDAGGALVAENQMLFGQLRLSATPTIVTPTGIFVSGSAKADELAVILSK